MPVSPIHIEPGATGRWTVRRGDEREARPNTRAPPRLSALLESWPISMVSRWFSTTATRASTACARRGRTDITRIRGAERDVSFS